MKVLIIDGSDLIRGRLLDLLRDSRDIEVVGQSSNAIDAITDVWRLRPDIVVMDIQLPAGNGIEVLHKIKQHQPGVTVIVLTECSDTIYRHKCLSSGADFILDKASQFYDITDVLKQLNSDKQVNQDREAVKVLKAQEGV
jgi:DNA-binding NarL/FixJ family response regulator